MTLHAKNIVMMTDAQGEEVEILVQRLVEQGTLRIDVAEVELAKLRNKRLCAFLKILGFMNSMWLLRYGRYLAISSSVGRLFAGGL